MDNYQKRIFDQYPSIMQDADSSFNKASASAWARPYIRYFRTWLPFNKNAAICDVGCGGGNLLYYLKSIGYTTVNGVDISAPQVLRARQVGVQVEQGDIVEFLDSQKSKYDLILAIDVIEHLAKDRALKFFDVCNNALREGGRLIIQTPNPESPWGGQILYGDLTHETGFTPNLLEKLLKSAGFDSIEAREAGPVVHGLISLIRSLLWKILHLGLEVWNMIETGDKSSNIYTRVYLISGIKKAKREIK
jgi:2-polyprenyl-3-methyl-5-hydroxy-6-metoxy-1,4-benzoquinol methylase